MEQALRNISYIHIDKGSVCQYATYPSLLLGFVWGL